MTELTTLQTDYEAQLAAAKVCHTTCSACPPSNSRTCLNASCALTGVQAANEALKATAAADAEAASVATKAAADAAAAELEEQKRLLQVSLFCLFC